MANLNRHYPLDGIHVESATRLGPPGVVITEIRDVAVCQLMALRGYAETLASALQLSVKPGLASIDKELLGLPLAPGLWMLIAATNAGDAFAASIAAQVKGQAHVSDQSHAKTILRVSGSKARDVMMKGCRLDLDPTVFSAGMCAQTLIAETSVALIQTDNQPSYDLIFPSSFAHTIWHWLAASAAEFGYRHEIAGPGAYSRIPEWATVG